MTPEENRRRIERLRAEEAGPVKTGGSTEKHYGPERRRQAQINKQRMGEN